jgi:hypothetical protein
MSVQTTILPNLPPQYLPNVVNTPSCSLYSVSSPTVANKQLEATRVTHQLLNHGNVMTKIWYKTSKYLHAQINNRFQKINGKHLQNILTSFSKSCPNFILSKDTKQVSEKPNWKKRKTFLPFSYFCNLTVVNTMKYT